MQGMPAPDGPFATPYAGQHAQDELNPGQGLYAQGLAPGLDQARQPTDARGAGLPGSSQYEFLPGVSQAPGLGAPVGALASGVSRAAGAGEVAGRSGVHPGQARPGHGAGMVVGGGRSRSGPMHPGQVAGQRAQRGPHAQAASPASPGPWRAAAGDPGGRHPGKDPGQPARGDWSAAAAAHSVSFEPGRGWGGAGQAAGPAWGGSAALPGEQPPAVVPAGQQGSSSESRAARGQADQAWGGYDQGASEGGAWGGSSKGPALGAVRAGAAAGSGPALGQGYDQGFAQGLMVQQSHGAGYDGASLNGLAYAACAPPVAYGMATGAAVQGQEPDWAQHQQAHFAAGTAAHGQHQQPSSSRQCFAEHRPPKQHHATSQQRGGGAQPARRAAHEPQHHAAQAYMAQPLQQAGQLSAQPQERCALQGAVERHAAAQQPRATVVQQERMGPHGALAHRSAALAARPMQRPTQAGQRAGRPGGAPGSAAAAAAWQPTAHPAGVPAGQRPPAPQQLTEGALPQPRKPQAGPAPAQGAPQRAVYYAHGRQQHTPDRPSLPPEWAPRQTPAHAAQPASAQHASAFGAGQLAPQQSLPAVMQQQGLQGQGPGQERAAGAAGRWVSYAGPGQPEDAPRMRAAEAQPWLPSGGEAAAQEWTANAQQGFDGNTSGASYLSAGSAGFIPHVGYNGYPSGDRQRGPSASAAGYAHHEAGALPGALQATCDDLACSSGAMFKAKECVPNDSTLRDVQPRCAALRAAQGAMHSGAASQPQPAAPYPASHNAARQPHAGQLGAALQPANLAYPSTHRSEDGGGAVYGAAPHAEPPATFGVGGYPGTGAWAPGLGAAVGAALEPGGADPRAPAMPPLGGLSQWGQPGAAQWGW